MAVYLLHFQENYKHARHYLGYADNLSARLAQHKAGNGARLMEVIHDAGISWVVARIWPGGRDLERKLKGYHSGVKLCPICNGKVPPASRPAGRRVPMQAATRYFP